jgi:hypothetical protein
MKRLLDESTDELTRSLLAAGVEHRPPPGNKAQVIMALGAGSAFGLFSSNAFAWLGTTAGKVTAAGAAVGLAGAVFVAASAVPARERGDTSSGGALRSAVAVNAQAEGAPVGSGSVISAPVRGAAGGSATAAPSDRSGSREALPLIAEGAGEPSASQAGERAADDASQVTRSGERRSRAWARKNTSKKRRGSASGAASEGDEAMAGAGSTSPAALEVAAREASALDTEVRLVDDMHGAARRNDRAALARYVDEYRASFPEGQLRSEVAEFAARLERSDAR